MHEPSSSPRVAPIPALIVGILSVSTASIFIRFAQQDAPSLVIAAYRMALAALLLAPLAFSRYRDEFRNMSGKSLAQLALAGLFLAVHFAAWITSLEMTSVASSVVLVTTTPLWVALISPFVLHERLLPMVWIGLAVALLGGTVVGLQQGCQLIDWRLSCSGFDNLLQGRSLLGNLLALTGAFMAAGYLTIGRQVRNRLSLVTYTFTVYGMAAVFLLLFVALAGLPMSGYQPATYAWFIALAVIPQLLGHSIFNWALRYLPAAFVSIALLGEPVGTTLLAVVFLKEAPAPVELLGGALILIGIYLTSQAGQVRRRKANQAPS